MHFLGTATFYILDLVVAFLVATSLGRCFLR